MGKGLYQEIFVFSSIYYENVKYNEYELSEYGRLHPHRASKTLCEVWHHEHNTVSLKIILPSDNYVTYLLKSHQSLCDVLGPLLSKLHRPVLHILFGHDAVLDSWVIFCRSKLSINLLRGFPVVDALQQSLRARSWVVE